MNIYHHHTIHLCRGCSGPRHSDAAPSETNAPRSRPSFLGALVDLARFGAVLSLVRATGGRPDEHPDGTDGGSTASLAGTAAKTAARDDRNERTPATATDLPSANAILALFSKAAREHEQGTDAADTADTPMDTKAPLSPFTAAFLNAFRDEPPRA